MQTKEVKNDLITGLRVGVYKAKAAFTWVQELEWGEQAASILELKSLSKINCPKPAAGEMGFLKNVCGVKMNTLLASIENNTLFSNAVLPNSMV